MDADVLFQPPGKGGRVAGKGQEVTVNVRVKGLIRSLKKTDTDSGENDIRHCRLICFGKPLQGIL